MRDLREDAEGCAGAADAENSGVRMKGEMNVTCGRCGCEDSIEAWTERPVTGRLPQGQFQCPRCGFAFKRKEVEPGSWFEWQGQRQYIPGKIGLVPCESVM